MTKKEIKRLIKGYINTNNICDFDSDLDKDCTEDAKAKLTSLVKDNTCASVRIAKIDGHYRIMTIHCKDLYDFTVNDFSIGGMETHYYKINDFVNAYAC